MPTGTHGGSSTPRRGSITSRDLNNSGGSDNGRHGSSQLLGASMAAASPGSPSNLPTVSPYWDQPYDARSDGGLSDDSYLDPTALQAALPPDFRSSQGSTGDHSRTSYKDSGPFAGEDVLSRGQIGADADTIPLTSSAQPISGSLSVKNYPESHPRDSFQTVSDVDNSTRGPRDTLHPEDVEFGRRGSRHRNYGMSLMPNESTGSRPLSTSGALSRAGSIVRAMSQRVVNISGEAELAEQIASRHRSRSPAGSERGLGRDRSHSVFEDTAYHSPAAHLASEKTEDQRRSSTELPNEVPRQPAPNPLKGRTLNTFSADSRVRNWLCDLLVYPYTEPLILLLIVLQTVLLIVESATSVYKDGNGRPDRWGQRWTDWALLALFIIFTMELVARIIVSGFILNAAEYSTIDRTKGLRVALTNQYRSIFQPEKQKSGKTNSVHLAPESSTISRSFTTLVQGQQALPETLEEQQRYHLARRAFLRHSFNRLDFVAVVSFWISFVLGVAGLESQYHLPYDNTVNFDNILQSLELVFVIMSSNTFTGLMYDTMGSDYTAAALFFAAGIMILTLCRQNLFDLFLAVITSIILLPVIRRHRAYAWLTVFQIVRAYRVVLAIPITRQLILLVVGNAAGIANLMMFVFLMTFLMAVLASQLFRGELPVFDDGELVRASFYTIYNSFLGMYQILTSENWTDILFSVTGYLTERETAWIGATFLIGWFILSFFILISMFIAVIQENFDISEDEKRLEQVKAFLQQRELGSSSSNLALSTVFTLGRSHQRRDPLDYGPAMTEMLLKDAVVREFLDEPAAAERDHLPEQGPPPRAATTLLGNVKTGFLSKLWSRLVRRVAKREPNPFYSNTDFNKMKETLDAREMAQQAVSASSERRRAQREYLAKHPTYNNSLYFFAPKNRLRRLCQRLVGPARGGERFDGVEPNKVAWFIFSVFIYAAIVAMVVIACITTPLYQRDYQLQHENDHLKWYVWTDLAFAILFTGESIIKVIADGLVSTPNAYLRSSWGFVDAVVLITLWINVGTLIVNDGAVSRAIGAFKALRALRLLNVSNSARDTFHSLIIVGWWKIFGAAFISISLLIPFAIYGLNLFNALLVSCNDGDGIVSLQQCFGEYQAIPYSDDWPLLAPRIASNPFYNFDDFGSSLFTLFQLVSQEGWADATYTLQAITARGQQPEDLASEGNAMFMVVFNIMATVFILTLFISVFMRNYTEQTGVAYLTADQRSWLELRKLLRQISPSKSSYDRTGSHKLKRWCHKRAIEKRGKWYQAVTVVLILHLLLLVVEYTGEPFWWTITRSVLFVAFSLVYLGNVIIRVLGLGWARYRKSSWDLFALFTVSGALVCNIALVATSYGRDTVLQIHKFFLVAILLLIIPRNDALDQLFKTAAASLPVIGNLLATWLVLFLVFAIAFTQAFSLTRFGEEAASDINFRSVPKALILLFRMSFGEGWNEVMEGYAAIEPPLCVEEDNFFDSDCGSKPWARFLFIMWNLLSMYIFVNLFVSLIYESFSYVYQRSAWVAAVDRDEIRRFKEAWRHVDPAGTGAISKEAFPRLLGELSGVFQMRIYDPEDSVQQILDDVRGDATTTRHTSLATHSGPTEIDLDKLNARIAKLDVAKIRERRRRFNIFYEEVLVSADPDKGITFTSVLLILANWNIIHDSKSLKLDEFLRRRARLQRVDDSVRRKTVQGFFYTVYWARRFKKRLQAKQSARMTGEPQLDIPDIFVDDEDDTMQGTRTTRESSRRPSLQAGSGMAQWYSTPTQCTEIRNINAIAPRNTVRIWFRPFGRWASTLFGRLQPPNERC
ncbi:Calcium-channel protein-like protein [Emericellopsis cladophorae]|uniref:Calcium-channel protein CCH1 n=1 Tax=Emericellopsis cladophorae TaxID=2686198 RepID=A0A9P9XWG6_9HYPO|nr:Calcium-channel protein-like protein [Emericellopsis cladophorae]KAI6779097.1 Calcium-channel protein-like protein [Emericellopsis cladophorae]